MKNIIFLSILLYLLRSLNILLPFSFSLGWATTDQFKQLETAQSIRSLPSSEGGWLQIGSDIIGEAAGDRSGYAVSMSSGGSVLAIGAYYNDGNGSDSGHVRVYAWDETQNKYVQRGADIIGEAAGDISGAHLSGAKHAYTRTCPE